MKRKFTKEPGDLGFSVVWNNYKNNAKVRKLPFDLTKDEVQTLTKQNCHYCGAEPKTIARVHSGTASARCIERSRYVYNGIDRIDSTLGYNIMNCSACCKKCNVMKSNFSVSEFLQHIDKIHNFNRGF